MVAKGYSPKKNHFKPPRPAMLCLAGWFKWLPVLNQFGMWREDRVCPLSSAAIDNGLYQASVADTAEHQRIRFYWGSYDCFLDIIVNVANCEIEILCCILHDFARNEKWVSTKIMLEHQKVSKECDQICEWDEKRGQVIPCCESLYQAPLGEDQTSDAEPELDGLLHKWLDENSDDSYQDSDDVDEDSDLD